MIYLAAPRLDLRGTVSVAGGAGGRVGTCTGGAGGVGRLRLSTLPSQCGVSGTTVPPVVAGCAVTTAGSVTSPRAYVGMYPD